MSPKNSWCWSAPAPAIRFESNGSMAKTDGGYLVSANKHFASQSAVGDILVTSAPFMDEVLHFPVPFKPKASR